jgi:hypothetical protein
MMCSMSWQHTNLLCGYAVHRTPARYSYRTRSAKQHARKTCLPHQQDFTPYVVKKNLSCAPEDGQKLARNMLS